MTSRIIILPHSFEPNYTLGFVKGLVSKKIDVIVISSDDTDKRLSQAGIENINLQGDRSEARSLIKKIFSQLSYYVRLLLYLLKNRPDIIHFTGVFRTEFLFFEGIVLHTFLKLVSKKYIFTAHNILPHNKSGSALFKLLHKFIYALPNVLLVHTDLSRKQLINEFGIDEKKISVISIGLNEEVPITGLTKKKARKMLNYEENDNVVLFFGKLDEYKGLDTLIESMNIERGKKIKLQVVGWWANHEYKLKIEKMIANSMQRDNIRLNIEYISNDEVEKYFVCADVIALPYRKIYQTGVLFLSLRFGIPVVATKVGALENYIEKDIGIIAKSNSPEGFSEALNEYFNEQLVFDREKIINRAMQYRWENICKKIAHLYIN